MLQRHAAGKDVLEIGSAFGASAIAMIQGGAKSVTCIDPFWEGADLARYDTFRENVEPYPEITHHRERSEKIVPQLPDKHFDLAFIDGCHKFDSVSKDILVSIPKLKDDGLLAFHDYAKDGRGLNGPVRAVNTYFPVGEHVDLCVKLVVFRKDQFKGDLENPCWLPPWEPAPQPSS